MMTLRRRQPAQALAFGAASTMLVLLAVALLMDAALLFGAQRQALGLADAAARAGAQQVDTAALRTDTPVQLDIRAAEAAARDYVVRHGPAAKVDAAANRRVLTVRVEVVATTLLLRMPGQGSVTVSGEATAAPCIGIDGPACP